MAQDLAQIAARALVLDANILLRAVVGLRVRSLIERFDFACHAYCARVAPHLDSTNELRLTEIQLCVANTRPGE